MIDMTERGALYDTDRGDLDPSSQQLELYDALLAAVGGDFAPPARRGGRDKCSRYRRNGTGDVAGWLIEQTWCAASDRLHVAQFWGGDELREQVLARLEARGLAVAA
jgi:hypothetical protein